MKSKFFGVILGGLLALAGVAGAQEVKTIDLKPENTLVLRGPVDSNSASKAVKDLLTSQEETVYLFLASPGGSIFAGLELVDTIKSSGKNVICVADFAASMAFVILQACNERYVTQYGVLMQHVASFGLQGEAPNNFSMTSFLRSVFRKMNKEQADRLGMSVSDFNKKTRSDWWLMGSDAVKNNAADGVAQVRCSKELINKKETIDVATLFFTVTLTFSGCPTISQPIEQPKANRFVNSLEAEREYVKTLKSFDPKGNMRPTNKKRGK